MFDPWESPMLYNTWQWWYSSLNNPVGVVMFEEYWQDGYSIVYPSFRERSNIVPRGQCPAFAKVATQDDHGTGSWYAGTNVMDRARQFYDGYFLHWDPSEEHQGRMVAYFGKYATGKSGGSLGSQYPQNAGSPGHVGIFLKYSYDENSMPNGFWIIDENYEGTADDGNPDGRIRKHLILTNPVYRPDGRTPLGHTYADKYFFVEILP